MKFTEFFNAQKLKYILDNYDIIKKDLKHEESNGQFFNDEHTKTILEKYLLNSELDTRRKKNKIIVNYKQSKSNVGRYYAVNSLSLQNIKREIRHTIAGDYYYDVDIVNCHPNILLYYAKTKNLSCKYLSRYCEKRETIINEVIEATKLSKDKIKVGFLQLINGGESFLKSSNLPKFAFKFNKEVKEIQKFIYENEKKYKKLGDKNANEKKENNKFYNPLGSTTNMLLQDFENNILQCMVDYLIEHKITPSSLVLVFDGLMIYKPDVDDRAMLGDLIEKLEKIVFKKLDIKIKLAIKPMDEGLKIDDNLLINYKIDEVIIAMNDSDAAEILIKELKDDIVRCNNIIFLKDNNLWIHNSTDIENELIKKLFKLNIRKYKMATETEMKTNIPFIIYNGIDYCLKKYEDYSRNLQNAMRIIKSAYTFIKVDNLFMKTIYETTKNKLFFNNGYYDFDNKIFINNFNNVYTTKKINRDYKEDYIKNNKSRVDEVYNRVLKPVLGDDLVNEMLLFTARAMAGMTGDKLYGLFMSERDGGKSKLKNLNETAFQDYVGIINMNSLLLEKNGGDESKKLSWLVDSFDKRLLFGSEVRLSGTKIDGCLIKSICSGSDKIKMRQNYKNESDFYIQCTLTLLCNDLPTMEPLDTIEKMVPFNCPHKFMDVITEEDKIINPHFKLADPTIDSFVMDELNGEAFVYIVIDNYKNHKTILNNKQIEFLENFKTEDEFKKFNEEFEITKNINDKIKTEDLKKFIQLNDKFKVSLPKLSLYIINRGCIHKPQIKIEGKTYNGYLGIRKMKKEEEDDDDCKFI